MDLIMRPLFSIIVVSLNAKKLINYTIDSILNQSYMNFEIIIKDGCSADGTLSNIPIDNRIKIYQEKDKGIYDAMNYAITYSSGRFICFLNCGDVFYDNNVLERVADQIHVMKDQKCIIYGNYYRKNVLIVQPQKLSNFYLYRTPLCHQSIFISSDLLFEIGMFNTVYKILADYDLTLRCWFNNIIFYHSDVVICNYLGCGVSETKRGIHIKRQEYKIIRKKYFLFYQRILYGFVILISLKKLREIITADKSPYFIRKMYRKIANFINK